MSFDPLDMTIDELILELQKSEKEHDKALCATEVANLRCSMLADLVEKKLALKR